MIGMPLRRAPSWVHSDGAGAVIIGIAYMANALTYFGWLLVPPNDWPAHVLEGLASRPAWGVVWGGVGMLCVISAFWRRALPISIGLAVGLGGLWGLSWAVESIVEHQARHAATAVGWILVSVLVVWAMSRGKAGEVRLARGARAGDVR